MTDDRKRVDLTGRVCIVTGANTGIGLEIARGLSLLRAHVVLACRSEERGRAAAKDITDDTCNDAVDVVTIDLGDQASVRACAARLLEKYPAIHVLVNNAGVWCGEREVTKDGIERTWATNVLGPHLLTALLLDRLKASAPARIVNVASTMARHLDLDDVEYAKRSFSGQGAYMQSKQANRMLTWRLSERLEGTKVVANAVHPGFVKSDLARSQTGLFGTFFGGVQNAFARTAKTGAHGALWLASSPDMEMSSGLFVKDEKKLKCRFRDETEGRKLEALCDRMTGLAPS